jgi:hypothetical protein
MCGKGMLSVAAAVLILAGTIDASAQDDQPDFTGLWQGIDNVDGSLRTLSFADLDDDGVWEVRGHDTYWTLCDGPGGLEDTTGKIEKGVLHTTGTLSCANGKKVPMETRYEPQGSLDEGMVVEHVVGKAFRTLLFRINQ